MPWNVHGASVEPKVLAVRPTYLKLIARNNDDWGSWSACKMDSSRHATLTARFGVRRQESTLTQSSLFVRFIPFTDHVRSRNVPVDTFVPAASVGCSAACELTVLLLLAAALSPSARDGLDSTKRQRIVRREEQT